MTQAILLMDIGGTNTRARIFASEQGLFANNNVIAERSAKISTRIALLDFISNLLSEYSVENSLGAAVLCFAGPVINHSHVSLTNWPEPRNNITFSDLVKNGLPADGTFLVNDMEAAAWSLLNKKYEHDPRSFNPFSLYPVVKKKLQANNNMILLMPGTGIGIATIVAGAMPGYGNEPVISSAEIQHSAIPALDPEHARLINEFSRHLGKDYVSWEDFISGGGLENIYSAMENISSNISLSRKWSKKLSADKIAELAVINGDASCQAALSLYYRCLGLLAQVLALTIQPFDGIYLMGKTTKHNFPFIPQSGFLQTLQNSRTQAELLKEFPVYLITEDLNLDGAACIAQRQLQHTTQISLFA
jgi:glucokinase